MEELQHIGERARLLKEAGTLLMSKGSTAARIRSQEIHAEKQNGQSHGRGESRKDKEFVMDAKGDRQPGWGPPVPLS